MARNYEIIGLKHMKKNIWKLVSLIVFPLLLGGCNNENADLLSFGNEVGYNSSFIVTKDSGYASLFSEDLCIVPEEQNQGSDTAITAAASLNINITDDSLIYADHVYDKLYPASITKLFTALVVLKYGNLEDTVTVGYNAVNITEPGAKKCGFSEGDQIKMSDLLTAFLVYSGNDAGIAIAEHMAGSVLEFSDMMNETAKEIGAVDSHFVNPHGLHDEEHYTTAYDIYLVFHELIKYPEFLEIINQAQVTVPYVNKAGESKQSNPFDTTNRYLKGEINPPEGFTILGGKTGTTNAAGSCLVLYAKDSNNKEYISVLLKLGTSDELFSQMNYLLQLS